MRMNKGPLGLALLAIVALAITGIVGAGASASGGTAVVAKKKCKKHTKQADSAFVTGRLDPPMSNSRSRTSNPTAIAIHTPPPTTYPLDRTNEQSSGNR